MDAIFARIQQSLCTRVLRRRPSNGCGFNDTGSIRRVASAVYSVRMGDHELGRHVPEVRTERVHALDGLRGMAAFAVLLSHCLIIFPALASSYNAPDTIAAWSIEWWVALTPLHLIWAGQEGVIVFFVLSGYVLTRPYALGRTENWLAWYPQRLVRLFLPAWAALAFALTLFFLIPRYYSPLASWLTNLHAEDATLGAVLKAFALVAGQQTYILSPLWSLQWEVIFSVLLPVGLWVYIRCSIDRSTLTALLLALLLIVASMLGHFISFGPLEYLPMFGIGVLMAHSDATLKRCAVRLSNNWWKSLVVLSLLLVPARWYLQPLGLMSNGGVGMRIADSTAFGISILACSFIVLAAAFWEGMARPLGNRVAQWLGKRSFSLYLVHETIIVSAVMLVGPKASGWGIVAGFLISIIAAEIFFRLVERPSHSLSRIIGGRIRLDIAARALSRSRSELERGGESPGVAR